MINGAVNFRMLEIYARSRNMHTGMSHKSDGLLGSVIPFEIPELFKGWVELSQHEEINSDNNPIKIQNGKFFFGKNGVTSGRTGWMINMLLRNMPEFAADCCPFVLKTVDMSRFMLSDYKYAMTSWEKHSRFVIKVPINSVTSQETEEQVDVHDEQTEEQTYEQTEEKTEEQIEEYDEENSEGTSNEDFSIGDNFEEFKNKCEQYEIWIIDPWMRRLPAKLDEKIKTRNNPILTIKLANRIIKDQDKEGSCVLCAVSRLVYLMSQTIGSTSTTQQELINILNQPIPDFYAYLAKYLFRKTKL